MPEYGDNVPADLTQKRARDVPLEHQTAFLLAYSQTLNVASSAEAAGISRESHYRWLKDDPTYAERFDAARIQAFKRAEAEGFRRAVDGVERYRIAGGELIPDPDNPGQFMRERVYSDSLLQFMLKGNDPRYRDTSDVRLSSPSGGPILLANVDPHELARVTLDDPKAQEAAILLGEAIARAASAKSLPVNPGAIPATPSDPDPAPEG